MSSTEIPIIKVAITGAAGRIAYSLIPLLSNGSIFGRPVELRLLDLPESYRKLESFKLEIEDSCFEFIRSVTITTSLQVAFEGADVVILLGGYPRLPGMERRDVINLNVTGIQKQAAALNRYAKKDVKVLVVANPANTNCLVAMVSASSIPSRNFTCLTRLDHERLRGLVVKKINEINQSNILSSAVKGVAIFGNHSSTQVPCLSACMVEMSPGVKVPLSTIWEDADPESPDMKSIVKKVQGRGAEILQYSGASSALSAAVAIAKHLASWIGVASDDGDDIFSMGVLSNGNPYGVPENLVFSFPCRRVRGSKVLDGNYEIASHVELDTYLQSMIATTVQDLESEKSEAISFVGPLALD